MHAHHGATTTHQRRMLRHPAPHVRRQQPLVVPPNIGVVGNGEDAGRIPDRRRQGPHLQLPLRQGTAIPADRPVDRHR